MLAPMALRQYATLVIQTRPTTQGREPPHREPPPEPIAHANSLAPGCAGGPEEVQEGEVTEAHLRWEVARQNQQGLCTILLSQPRLQWRTANRC